MHLQISIKCKEYKQYYKTYKEYDIQLEPKEQRYTERLLLIFFIPLKTIS